MFRRTKSFNAKNGGRDTAASSRSSGGPSLRLFRRNKHHRRSQSEPDANQKAVAAIKKQQDQEQDHEGVLRLTRSDLQVGKILGEGGFAQVFSVKLKKNKRICRPQEEEEATANIKVKLALKQLRPQLLKDKDLFERASDALVREARTMTMLRNHNNILTIRGISSDANFDSFLITDALYATMTDRVLKWNTTTCVQDEEEQRWMHKLQYCLQVAQALAYCHEHRIVYRDCKVDNLGFSDEHTVQLFDFGLARELPPSLEDSDDDDARTCTSSIDEAYGGEEVFRMTICGTQRHMAKEAYDGWYNCKADVYGWAMTVVELITGKKPYPYMSLPVHKILVLEGGGRPNLEGLGFPVGLQHILKRAWEHNLADRWTMNQVCAALETYIGSECSQQGVAQQPKEETTPPTLLQDQACANNHLDMVQQQQQQEEESEPVLAGAA